MLQNTRVTAFTISEFLRENQLEGGERVQRLPNLIRVHKAVSFCERCEQNMFKTTRAVGGE